MKALGFSIVRCGPDGAEAWKIAAEWNKRWQKVNAATLRRRSMPQTCHAIRPKLYGNNSHS
jgi:hypothetical protein